MHVIKENGEKEFRILFLRSATNVTYSEPRLEFRSEIRGISGGPVTYTTIAIRLFFPIGQTAKVLRRLDIVMKILVAGRETPDLRIFPYSEAVSVPTYAQSELDQYEAHRINEEFLVESHQKAVKTQRALMASGPQCSKRAKLMLMSLHGDDSLKNKSYSQSNTAHRTDWMKSMKVAQGRICNSNASTGVTPQTKISSFFRPPSNLEGFKNLGNTCYISAIVSVLLSLPALAADIEIFCETVDPKNNDDARLLKAFRQLFYQVKAKNHGVLNLSSLKDAISSSAKRFAGREQHDAHEFYCSCIDLLTTELHQIAKRQSPASPSHSVPGSRSLHELIATDRNLRLRVRHTLVCANAQCAYRRSRAELFRDVSLCIPDHDAAGVAALDGLLEAFFADNHLEYTCDKCGHGSARAVHKVLDPRAPLSLLEFVDISLSTQSGTALHWLPRPKVLPRSCDVPSF